MQQLISNMTPSDWVNLGATAVLLWPLFFFWRRSNRVDSISADYFKLENAVTEMSNNMVHLFETDEVHDRRMSEIEHEIIVLTRVATAANELAADTRYRIVPVILEKLELKLKPPRNSGGNTIN